MNCRTFQNQVVIVTGASAGIGQALALQLADQGAWVALAARRQDRLAQVAAECRRRGGRALSLPTDVASQAQCKALVEDTIREFDRLDMLVNNPGLSTVALFEALPNLDLFRHTMEVNFYGNVYTTYYALPHIRQSQGRWVSIASVGSNLAIPGNTSLHCQQIRLKWLLRCAPDGMSTDQREQHRHLSLLGGNRIPRKHAGQRGITSRPSGVEALYRSHDDRRPVGPDCAQGCRPPQARSIDGPGAFALWVKLVMPGLLDRLILRFFFKSVVHRLQQEE